MSRARGMHLILFGSLLLSATVFVATGAFAVTEPADRVDDDLALQPAPEGGNYSYLDADDELVVDLSASNPELDADGEGINDEARTGIDHVFHVHYSGDEYADVWLDHDADPVTFTVDGESVEGESNAVRLDPATDTVTVGLRVDTRLDTSGAGIIDDVTVHGEIAEPDADETAGTATTDIRIREPAPDERAITVRNPPIDGETVLDLGLPIDAADSVWLAAATIERTTGDDADLEAEAQTGPAAGEPLGVEAAPATLGTVTLDDATDAVTDAMLDFRVDAEALAAVDADADDLTVYTRTDDAEPWRELDATLDRGADGVTLTVDTDGFSEFAVAAHRPHVTVTDTLLDARAVEAGGEVTVQVDLRNDGGAAGSEEVVLTADGEPVATATVDIEPGETTTATLTATFDDPGEYALAVDGEPLGTVSVEEAGDAEGAAVEVTPAGEGPVEEPSGFGLGEALGLLALVAIVAVTLTLVRRMPRGEPR